MFERHKIKKILKPRKDFAEQTKTAFLTVYDRAHPATTRASGGFSALARILVACGALIAIFAGASVYADTANVAADSPLYPLKRLGESVQLAVTPAAEKSELQATFAARRASEIVDLETRKPSSTQIASLSSDLNTALNTSLNDAQNAKLGDGKLAGFCEKILPTMKTSRPDIVGRFLNQCGKSIATTTIATTTIATTTSTATSTASSTHIRHNRTGFHWGL